MSMCYVKWLLHFYTCFLYCCGESLSSARQLKIKLTTMSYRQEGNEPPGKTLGKISCDSKEIYTLKIN